MNFKNIFLLDGIVCFMLHFLKYKFFFMGQICMETDKKEYYRRLRHVFLISLAVLCVAVLLLILSLNGLRIPCVFNKITGLSCPGCGNTRAVMALFHLDIVKAFSYNLLFPIEFFYIGWVYIFSAFNYIKKKSFSYQTPFKYLDYFVFGAVVVWSVVRNIIGC